MGRMGNPHNTDIIFVPTFNIKLHNVKVTIRSDVDKSNYILSIDDDDIIIKPDGYMSEEGFIKYISRLYKPATLNNNYITSDSALFKAKIWRQNYCCLYYEKEANMNILIDDRFHCCVCGIRVKVPVKGDGYNLQDPNFFSEHAFLCM